MKIPPKFPMIGEDIYVNRLGVVEGRRDLPLRRWFLHLLILGIAVSAAITYVI